MSHLGCTARASTLHRRSGSRSFKAAQLQEAAERPELAALQAALQAVPQPARRAQQGQSATAAAAARLVSELDALQVGCVHTCMHGWL